MYTTPFTDTHTVVAMPSTMAEKPPATKPKRPLSAYNLFFQFERRRILNELPLDAPKIGFRDMAKKISKRWRAVEPTYKLQLSELANREKLRYAREMKFYRERLAEEAYELQVEESHASDMRTPPSSPSPYLLHEPTSPVGSKASPTTCTAMARIPNNRRQANDCDLHPSVTVPSDLAPSNVLSDATVAELARNLDASMVDTIIAVFGS